ncbi:MAG: hypothetical protein ACOC3D_11500, partial [Pseudomonadota bacterium]
RVGFLRRQEIGSLPQPFGDLDVGRAGHDAPAGAWATAPAATLEPLLRAMARRPPARNTAFDTHQGQDSSDGRTLLLRQAAADDGNGRGQRVARITG